MLIVNEETNKINRKQNNNAYITIFANLKNLQVVILKKSN